MKRLLVLACTGALVAVSSSALADSPQLGTSYAAAAKVTPGVGVAATITQSGDISGLLDFLTPVLNQVVNVLANNLSSLSNEVTTDLALGLAGTTFAANSSSSAQSPPASGFPDCSSAGWTSGNCYGPLVPTVQDPPVLTLNTGTLQGYATADNSGAYAAATTANSQLRVLGLSLGSLGVATSLSKCTGTGACTAQSSVTGVSLLGGVVGVRTASDGTVQVSVNGSSFAPLTSYSAPVSVSGGGLAGQVQADGAMARVSVQLSLDQLLTGLGIADVLGSLNASDAGSTITLTLEFGAGSTSSSSLSKAWGLDVAIGLSASVNISVLGLVTVSVTTGNPLVVGNLADIELAYSTAANPDGTNPTQAPPNLT